MRDRRQRIDNELVEIFSGDMISSFSITEDVISGLKKAGQLRLAGIEFLDSAIGFLMNEQYDTSAQGQAANAQIAKLLIVKQALQNGHLFTREEMLPELN